MNRRNFLKGFTTLSAAGLFLPEKRIWALDQTMMGPSENKILEWMNTPLESVGGIYHYAYFENVAPVRLMTEFEFYQGLKQFSDEHGRYYRIDALK